MWPDWRIPTVKDDIVFFGSALVIGLIMAVVASGLSCQSETIDGYNQRAQLADNIRVGQRIPEIMRIDLVEETPEYTVWNPKYGLYVTCKRDTIVAIWRKQ